MARLQTHPQVAAAALLAVWCTALAAGFYAMMRYDFTPSARASSPADWPSGLRSLAPGLALARKSATTLVLFAHPQCPCTRATIGDIAAALAHEPSPSSMRVYTVFYEPSAAAGQHWRDSDLVRSARALPNSVVLFDPEGRIARRFGAETSGQTYVYSAEGRLLFTGGVTASRGHFGDSIGGNAIAALSRGQEPAVVTAPVFGCSLLPAHAAHLQLPSSMNSMSMLMDATPRSSQ